MKDLQSLDDKVREVWDKVGYFLYSNMDLVNGSMSKLWDFYDMYPDFYNRLKLGRVSLKTMLEYDYDKVNAELDSALELLSKLEEENNVN